MSRVEALENVGQDGDARTSTQRRITVEVNGKGKSLAGCLINYAHVRTLAWNEPAEVFECRFNQFLYGLASDKTHVDLMQDFHPLSVASDCRLGLVVLSDVRAAGDSCSKRRFPFIFGKFGF